MCVIQFISHNRLHIMWDLILSQIVCQGHTLSINATVSMQRAKVTVFMWLCFVCCAVSSLYTVLSNLYSYKMMVREVDWVVVDYQMPVICDVEVNNGTLSVSWC